MSSDTRPSNALIALPLLMLVFGTVLHVHWLVVVGGVVLVGWYVDYSLAPILRKRWYELLGAIRGRSHDAPRSENSSASRGGIDSNSNMLFPPEGFVDPPEGGFVPVRGVLERLEAEERAQEQKKRDDEKREQEAREFLICEMEVVILLRFLESKSSTPLE